MWNWFGVWEQISLLVTAVVCFSTRCSFTEDFCLCRGSGAASSAPSQRRAAHVVLYVNGALFVCVLRMLITPSFNPSLCLGSGTFPVACVQGLATRVAVTEPNLQQACSSVTICSEYVCIVNTIKVLDISFLHMLGIITSHNKRQVSEWHAACHAFPELACICVSLLPLNMFRCFRGCWKVRYQIRRLFIWANKPYVTRFGDIMQ